jgi:hypothetical protein
MRIFKALLAVSAAIASTAALGQADPRILVSLTPINSEVTLARPSNTGPSLSTLAAYTFTITNTSTNQLNRLYLRNAVAKTAEGMDVLWDSVNGIDPAACTGFGTSTLNCDTTLFAGANGGTASFIVVAQAPSAGSRIVVTYSGGGYEGNGVGNGCCANPGVDAVTFLVDSTTDNKVNNRAQSYLKKNSTSTLFTGDRYIAKTADQVTTFVSVPAFDGTTTNSSLQASYGLGVISEAPNPDANCTTAQRLSNCYTSDLSIRNGLGNEIDFRQKDGSGNPLPVETNPPSNFLTIVLRLDSSAIRRGTTVESVALIYTDETVTNRPVLSCADNPNYYPCWTERKVYRGGNRDFKDDFEWTIRHYKNGRYGLY